MFKYAILAAAAALVTAPAFAQAEVELEGQVLSFNNGTRILNVMGMQVEVPLTATIQSPAATRAETGLNLAQWFHGAALPGRGQVGFMGGTAIVIGTYNTATKRVIADDITIEPGENVNLGEVTANRCTTANCDGPNDYIRGNAAIGGAPGPAMIPIRDIRLPASPIGDEGGFALSMAGVNMVGMGYVAEGYYGGIAVPVGSPAGTVSERSFHYFKFDVLTPQPALLLNKTIREVSIERAQCRVGKDFEVRGSVHSRVNPNGTINDTVRPNNGVVQVQYTLNGVLVRNQQAAATPIATNSPIGGYRVRFNVAGACPSDVTVRWLPAANSAPTAAYASLTGFTVDVRLD